MPPTIERTANVVLTLAALVIVGVLVRRELQEPPRSSGPVPVAPDTVANWQQIVAQGSSLDSVAKPITVAVFTDFECPACQTFHTTLSMVRDSLRDSLRIILVHFPLPQHRFAKVAAIASECARAQGKLWAMASALYADQDSLGLKPFTSIAATAGVPDTLAFHRCVRSEGPIARITAGQKLGESIRIRGTPTVVLNGWRLPDPPTVRYLLSASRRVAAGRPVVAPSDSL